jgi:molecular chaperone GrpE
MNTHETSSEALSPDAQAAAAAEASPADLAVRAASLEAELGEMRDRWMRAEAEIANVRARARRDVDETRQYAVQKFARDVVEAAENLKRGLDSIPPAHDREPEIVAKLRDGFAGVERSFVALLERNGIRREDPTGAAYDANLHQAMAEQESSEHPPGTVIQAWTLAWTLNGRLLRPAMVVVTKAPAAELGGPASRP